MKSLIFVYNANSGLFNTITDSAHKLLSPKTYSCNLCKLTYGLKNMNESWKEFIESLPLEIEFLHRDEFHKQFPDHCSEALPAIFTQSNKSLKLAIPASELNQAESIEDLKKLVKKAITS